VIVPTWLVPDSVNQSLPSGPAVMSEGAVSFGSASSLTIVPLVPIRPIQLLGPVPSGAGGSNSVNQMAAPGPQPGPQAIPSGGPLVGPYWLITPDVVIAPILLRPGSVNQSRPSGPVTMSSGSAGELSAGMENS
jgi:hypothetical protein